MLVIPSVAYSVRYSRADDAVWQVGFNVVLFTALFSPFLMIYLFGRRGTQILPVVSGLVFSSFHAYLIYRSWRFKPQEFGYLGLVFVPFLEIAVGVPLAFLIVLVIARILPDKHRNSLTPESGAHGAAHGRRPIQCGASGHSGHHRSLSR